MQIYKDIFLSSGEKQKLLIDMLSDADIYLLDEPMIGLDEESIEKILDETKALIRAGKTVMIAAPEREVKNEKGSI